MKQAGIDFSTDTYDAGLHMNLSGVEKLSDYMGKFLKRKYDLVDRREDPKLAQKWKQRRIFTMNLKINTKNCKNMW